MASRKRIFWPSGRPASTSSLRVSRVTVDLIDIVKDYLAMRAEDDNAETRSRGGEKVSSDDVVRVALEAFARDYGVELPDLGNDEGDAA